jgi:hypothetical protein
MTVTTLGIVALVGIGIGWAYGRWGSADDWRGPVERYRMADEKGLSRLRAYHQLLGTSWGPGPRPWRLVSSSVPSSGPRGVGQRRGLPKTTDESVDTGDTI